ncbi:MAG TPA: PEP-CTERM sorting domain-containing protein [Cyanobacteria bacterium UBA8803]|nr:PEP-CTERM sorting domain-containing protein [Cyanobacteria bacterium UBA9273]HBL61556.1 PEP-CTERM sorting domain-containing protein [Cyanobacteria bacterium UBA8803]
MKTKLFTSLITTAALTSIFSITAPVSAYEIKSIDTDTTGFKDIIDEFQKLVQEEGVGIKNPSAFKLDPTKLLLAADHDVNIYFLNEGAGFKNQLGFSATKDSNSQSGLIFENVSCHSRNIDCRIPSNDGVLNIGDYVELGTFKKGTQFDFSIIADGFNGGQYVYGADPVSNPDGLEHLVAYEYKGYVVLGFEDLYGPKGNDQPPNQNSDRDFNDVLFVADLPAVKEVPEPPVKEVPEPSTTLSLLGIAVVSLVRLGHRRLSKTD